MALTCEDAPRDVADDGPWALPGHECPVTADAHRRQAVTKTTIPPSLALASKAVGDPIRSVIRLHASILS